MSHYNTILQQVSSKTILSINKIRSLDIEKYINNSKKANSTLGLIRRNLKNCPLEIRKLACITLVRSTLEYGSVVWDPCIQQDINAIEKVQQQAARFITKDHRSRESGCVTSLDRLNLPTLQQRREIDRLIYMFKIMGSTVRAINADEYSSFTKGPKDTIKLDNLKMSTNHQI